MDALIGITREDWLRLLRENNFAIAPQYWNRALAVTMMSLANTRDQRREEQEYGAEVKRAEIKPPLFILGHWRSGTTLLHELLALDEQFAYANLFQVSHPHTFLCREAIIEKALAQADTEQRPMDAMRVGFRSPGEDESALAVASLRSPMLAWSFPRNEAYYDRFLTFREASDDDLARWKAAFMKFLMKLSWRYGSRPLVLKSPPHTARLKLLLEMFPEARFVHIHRDPFVVFQSTRALYDKAAAASHLQRPDPTRIDAGILRRYAAMYEAFFEERDLIPAGRFCEIAFAELERDPLGQVQQIYAQLRLPGFDAVAPKMQAYVQARRDYRKNKHVPLAEPLRQRIVEAWWRSFATWGYATDGVPANSLRINDDGSKRTNMMKT
ncbi:MAG: sulfotransferase [candidate division KSB1 bacterium]|nr:sulfotransferase [candidate division KSB1 bacterium]MDZ7276576.1 sulfotransferase [candidate division KSB1 bacterium]MDZ7288251.1 sulfotransferase [candidate division KSB1 bacterium]MDZ7300358.1 sulfotransferase [candidate division KSB1 bacterium]MDZ7307318.1 sulfotransferase [candidate division KSB1 bacterium]